MPDQILKSTSNVAMLLVDFDPEEPDSPPTHRSFPELSEEPWQRAEREHEAVYGGIPRPDRPIDGTVR